MLAEMIDGAGREVDTPTAGAAISGMTYRIATLAMRGACIKRWRPEPESNRRARICSPLRNHSAIGPRLPRREAGSGQQRESRGAVADAVFLGGVHFAEGLKATMRHEHRVIAKAMRAARWPDPNALSLAFKAFLMPIGPGKHQGAGEPGGAVGGGGFHRHRADAGG